MRTLIDLITKTTTSYYVIQNHIIVYCTKELMPIELAVMLRGENVRSANNMMIL